MNTNIYSERELKDIMEKLNNPYFELKDKEQIHLHNVPCPKCKKGHIVIRNSKYGLFAPCNNPNCQNKFNNISRLKNFIYPDKANTVKRKIKQDTKITNINSEHELEHLIEQLDNPDFQFGKEDVIYVHNVLCPKCKKGFFIMQSGYHGLYVSCSNSNCNNKIKIDDFKELMISKLSDNVKNKFINLNPVTRYFENALSAQKQSVMNFKTETFVIEPATPNIENGFLNQTSTQELFAANAQKNSGGKSSTKKSIPQTQLNVVIALKTLSTLFENSSYSNDNAEQNELTSILFLPAILDSSGKLSVPKYGKLPWIPRNYLSPMIDAQIYVGNTSDYDTFLKNSTGERNRIKDDWKKYFNYAKSMYTDVTKNPYEASFITLNNQIMELENQCYVFIDKSLITTQHIKKLYGYLKNHPENKLYSTVTNLNPVPSTTPFRADDISQMIKHTGQMGGEYPLSHSQREAIHTFTELKEGEVLAVSGPPGTGKTTLLQSVVATMLVEHALQEKKPPVIVASSTNNQAVTNIISSFEKINAIGIGNLEKRWICGVNNFATYLPSANQQKDASEKGYQWTDNTGTNFFQNVEGEENRTDSNALFIQEFNAFFTSQYSAHDFLSAKSFLAKELKHIDNSRRAILAKIEDLKLDLEFKDYSSYSKYISNLDSQIHSLQLTISNHQLDITALENEEQSFRTRMEEWSTSYDALPILLKFLSFLPFCKKKLLTWFTSFQQEKEHEILKDCMSIEEIQETYQILIEKNTQNINNIKSICEDQKEKILSIEKEKLDIQTKYHELIKLFEPFKAYGVFTKPKDYETALDQLEVKNLNDLFDCKIRYIEFWLAVHYYEAVWLSEELNRKDAITNSPTKKSLTILFERIAMISPCMVMTFFMLPKYFCIEANKLNHYMINYIDLLIVDEAGQTSPEIAAASFSLAKKAIVVGDEKQIPPVWGTEEVLDKSIAVANKVIQTEKDFKLLEKNGLNCSKSSIMKVAAMSCIYDKFEKGLFLSEHRRCYDEIVQYCNTLVYGGHLEALRGSFENDNNPLMNYLPPMGHKEISVPHSQKKGGGSRCNEIEAQQITIWLQQNYPILLEKYKNSTPNEILGIITPFKEQSKLIKNELSINLPEYQKYISVGTVHTFQGAERKVIIFSSVYGNQDGCFFINQSKEMMNVAVSRAKDSFLVFGDSGCLVGGADDAAPLLKKATKQTF